MPPSTGRSAAPNDTAAPAQRRPDTAAPCSRSSWSRAELACGVDTCPKTAERTISHSLTSGNRGISYQNEELTLAIEQLRRRRPGDPWLIPVRFDECDIPDLDLGGGRTLTELQSADLFGDSYGEQAARLVQAIRRLLGDGLPGTGGLDRVSVAVVDDSLLTAEVINGSQGSLSSVGIYIIDKANGRIFARTPDLHVVMRPGETRRFALTRVTTPSAAPTRYYCVVQFTDGNRVSWNKYMMGGLEQASKGPPFLLSPACRSL